MQRFILTFLMLLPAVSTRLYAEEAVLELEANTPTLRIETRPAGINFMRLPDLQYVLRARVQCPADGAPSSLSVAVADTRVALLADDISTETIVDIEVPAAQIGPLAVGDFCSAESADSADIAVDSLLSAQGALHCQGETTDSVTYASVSLPVNLECQPADPAGDPEAE